MDLGWKKVMEQELKFMVETVLSMLQRDVPQRLTIPAIQMFVHIASKDKIEKAVLQLFDAAAGTVHMIVVPTLRYQPYLFFFLGGKQFGQNRLRQMFLCSIYTKHSLAGNPRIELPWPLLITNL